MAQAAFCSQCNANVYVAEDGGCPNGHGPESLSGFYETPDAEEPEAPTLADAAIAAAAAEDDDVDTPTMAEAAIAAAAADDGDVYAPTMADTAMGDAPTMAEAALADSKTGPTKSKLPWIIGGIVLLLVMCGVAACAGASFFISSATEEAGQAIDESVAELEEQMDAATEELAPSTEATAPVTTGEVTADDLEVMVEHFYPGFTLEGYYDVTDADAPEGAATYHVIAAYNNVPAFRITYFAYHYDTDDPAGFDVAGQAFRDETSGAWWIHPQTREHGLDSVFGPDALVGAGATLDQIATDFTAAHPTKVITSVSELTNADLGFEGIDEAALDDWYDDSTSFSSTWELDMQVSPAVWREVDYTE